MRHIGIVDIGSNTVRLVIYTVDDQQQITKVFDYKKLLQLLNFIDHQALSSHGLKALVETLDEYKQIASYYQSEPLICFGTASLRYLENKQEVVRRVHDYTGLELNLLSGEAEAMYGFKALAHSNILYPEGVSVDVGGGSTEIVHYRQGQIIHSISLPLGCLSLKIKHMSDLFPTHQDILDIQEDINTLLDQIHWLNNLYTDNLIGIGGSARALSKCLRALHPSKKMQHGDAMSMDFIHCLSVLEIKQQPELAPLILGAVVERSSTLHTGALLFSAIAKRVHAKDFVLSRFGLREGYIYHLLDQEKQTV